MSETPSRYEVRRIVREALQEETEAAAALSDTSSGTPAASSIAPDHQGTHAIITRSDLEAYVRNCEPLEFPPGTRFTMLAEEMLKNLAPEALSQTSTEEQPVEDLQASSAPRRSGPRDVVAIGGDHRGFASKKELAATLRERGYDVLDCGADDGEASDYPIHARKVAAAVGEGQAAAGIFIDGSGIGSAMVANKVAGVRAAHCRTRDEARSARTHNHAQVLTLAAGTDSVVAIVETFLRTPFGSGRHAQRVALMEDGS